MKKLAVILSSFIIAAGTAIAIGTAPAAHAAGGCDSSDFYMNLLGFPGQNMQDEGHNNKVQMENSNSTCFNLIGIGDGYFEFEDNNNECLNTGSDQTLYFDSCTGSTPEQFTSVSGSHEWTNRHYGTNDYLQASGNTGSYILVIPPNFNLAIEWATPAA